MFNSHKLDIGMVGKFWACLGASFCLLFVRPQAPPEPPGELRGFGQRSVEGAAETSLAMFGAASPKPDPAVSRFFRFAKAPKFAGAFILAPQGTTRLIESFFFSLQSRFLETGRGFSFSRLKAAETARDHGGFARGRSLPHRLFKPQAAAGPAELAGTARSLFTGFGKFKFETLKASRIVRAP